MPSCATRFSSTAPALISAPTLALSRSSNSCWWSMRKLEIAHSRFNRFRKLLLRYEKLERSFLGLNHAAAAIIAFRKVPLAINVIYG